MQRKNNDMIAQAIREALNFEARQLLVSLTEGIETVEKSLSSSAEWGYGAGDLPAVLSVWQTQLSQTERNLSTLTAMTGEYLMRRRHVEMVLKQFEQGPAALPAPERKRIAQ